jgi:hypothetical protein
VHTLDGNRTARARCNNVRRLPPREKPPAGLPQTKKTRKIPIFSYVACGKRKRGQTTLRSRTVLVISLLSRGRVAVCKASYGQLFFFKKKQLSGAQVNLILGFFIQSTYI